MNDITSRIAPVKIAFLVVTTMVLWFGSAQTRPIMGQSDNYEAWLELRDGSVIKANVREQVVPWLSVEKDGTITRSEKRLSEIRELFLTSEPASDQIANIRRLIDSLSSEDFRKRNEAEKALINQGGPFLQLIQIASSSGEPEVRYRIKRILARLDEAESQSIELDVLKTGKRGTEIEGDVRDWKIVGDINGREFSLDRSSLKRVYFENPLVNSLEFVDSKNQSVEVQPIVAHDGQFFLDNQTHVSFDADENGVRPSRNVQVHDLFAFLGCHFACENPGWEVIVSGFSFMKSISKNNSIGNHFKDPVTGKHERYTGVLEITFCKPGNPSVPAAVSAVGCFLEIVMPRHTLIETYNSAGNRIGMVEASANRTAFVGLKSNEPIARVRVMPNEYLHFERVEDDDLNEDFAVDDLCFGNLRLVSDVNRTNKFKLLFKSGEVLNCQAVSFEGAQVQIKDNRFGEKGLQFDKAELVSILGPFDESDEERRKDSMKVMLGDGSIVKASRLDGMNIEFGELGSIKLDEAIGLWTGPAAFYPENDDLEGAKAVVVYPIIRFRARNYELTDQKFSIPPDAIERIQQNPEDPTKGAPDPQVDSEAEGLSFAMDEVPSVWFKMPVVADSNAGMVRLRDGQQFILGGSSGFTLESTSENGVTITRDGKSLNIPIQDISAIRF